MSQYNYNHDPWADDGQSGQQGQSGNSNYYYNGSGSNNPNQQSTGYQQQQGYDWPQEQSSYVSSTANYGYQADNYQVESNPSQFNNEDKSQQEQQQHQQQQQNEPNQSCFRRFIGAHTPLGPVWDTCCNINLPFIDALLQHVNRDLLVSKMFYFFFYSAFGSLFPLMGVYFKQLGMNPAQVGILTGVRPFIEIFSAPFWNSLAERFSKRKALLIFSLISWIVFTCFLAPIRPPASACIAFNDTDYELYIPYSTNDLANPDSSQFTEEQQKRGLEISLQEAELDSPTNSSISSATQRYRRHINSQSLVDRESSGDFDESDQEEIADHGKIENRMKQAHKKDEEIDVNEYGSVESGKIERPQSTSSEEYPPEEIQEVSKAEEKPVVDTEKQELNSEQQESKLGLETAKILSTKTFDRETVKEGHKSERIENQTSGKVKRKFRNRHKTPPTHIVGMSPISVSYAAGYNKTKHSQFVTPMFSTIVYKLDDIKSVFFLLLLLICLGEFFSAPALTLADSATLRYLGDQVDLYCRQRMFGSLSWAITLLLVGMALDNATSIGGHPCGPHLRERSYTVCFIIFFLLMGCALMTATQFRFDDDNNDDLEKKKRRQQYNSEANQVAAVTQLNDGYTTTTTTTNTNNNYAGATFDNDPQQHSSYSTMTTNNNNNNDDDPYSSTQPRSIFNTAPPINEPPPGTSGQGLSKEKFEFLDKWKSAVFAQRTRELPQWVNVFRQFSSNSIHLTYLFITWFLGCGVGLVFTFLFWHLQDVGGTPTLFGICSVINHISEILAYFFSFTFIKRFGHTKVLSVGLGCNAIRFLYMAFLTNPYYALPFELVQGITHAACFAACCSYISHKSSPELKNSTQGVMQGLHHGIGRACGTLLGGFIINAIGSRATFALYGVLSGVVLAGFLHVRKKATAEELDIKVDDSDALGGYGAPQGVPGAKPARIY